MNRIGIARVTSAPVGSEGKGNAHTETEGGCTTAWSSVTAISVDCNCGVHYSEFHFPFCSYLGTRSGKYRPPQGHT